MRILVHVCCGPCSIVVLRGFAASGSEPHGFFYNPNIHPSAEYIRRRQGAVQAAARLDIPLLFADAFADERHPPESGQRPSGDVRIPAPAGDTPFPPAATTGNTKSAPAGDTSLSPAADPAPWLRAALDIIERGGDRCRFCLRARIFHCAGQARRLGYDAFSTTLLYSRRQRHDDIRALGEEAEKNSGIPFAYRDFRPLWGEGIRLSKEWGIYRQQYCGCLFSEYERHARGPVAPDAGV
jgi:predicted adenine nucleotide alpha hydrolase (AANH) superfamily ATPase